METCYQLAERRLKEFSKSDMFIDMVAKNRITNKGAARLLQLYGFLSHLTKDHRDVSSTDAAIITTFLQLYIQDEWEEYAKAEKRTRAVMEDAKLLEFFGQGMFEMFIVVATALETHEVKTKGLFSREFYLQFLDPLKDMAEQERTRIMLSKNQ